MALDRNCSPKSKWKYHVFLSFRGEDTRLGFTDHLYAALHRKSIITFRDDEELRKGEVIKKELLDAIEESISAIVIISKDYASSSWCLEELQKIVETKESREVFPVFYGVNPSDVRHQMRSFAEALSKHEEKFVQDKGKVERWSEALKHISNLAGWDSKNKHESELIEEIVAAVWTTIETKLPTYNDGLVAIDTKVDDMCSLLNLSPDSKDVRFVKIWGMGGIGKTTLATAVFKEIRSQFGVSCFLSSVRETSKKGEEGLIHLQNKFLSPLKPKSLIIETSDQGKDIIRNLLHNQKVLLVLDDVSAKSQLENLAGNQNWFGPGSRIIVTTRDMRLLISQGVSFEMYEMKTFNIDKSLQLLCEKAFKGCKPKGDYSELSRKVVEYAGGLPLALQVLGSLLCGRSVPEWEDAVNKLSKVPHSDIVNKLKISYDMLEDEYTTIFLDIAFFFKGCYIDKVTTILDNGGLHPTIGINVLIEKSLVTCKERILEMHDLLEEMGKTIVLQESPNDAGRRSRLWSPTDIDKVFRENEGTKKVQGVFLGPHESCEGRWHPRAFSAMCNLRILIILCHLCHLKNVECLPSSLEVLIWMEYPLKALPCDVQLSGPVHRQMSGRQVKQLWDGTSVFGKLKVIDLSYSRYLIETPNIFGVPNLEELFLDGCDSLVKVHQSVGKHKKLAVLSLSACTRLKILPRKLETSSLKMLCLCNCRSIKRLPDFGENMECLLLLNLIECVNLLCLPYHS